MTQAQTQITWEKSAQDKYTTLITKIPLFHREIAKQVVDKKAVINAQERGAAQVEECDIVRAFLSEVPMTFYSLMVRLMDEVGLDCKKYE